jgi:hypothetical protein
MYELSIFVTFLNLKEKDLAKLDNGCRLFPPFEQHTTDHSSGEFTLEVLVRSSLIKIRQTPPSMDLS